MRPAIQRWMLLAHATAHGDFLLGMNRDATERLDTALTDLLAAARRVEEVLKRPA
ncbi:MAG TPA: hypothetical protein VFC56_03890 [Stellaceae bacterium]|nr:hypothetical protein [Stellaceae bacterium]